MNRILHISIIFILVSFLINCKLFSQTKSKQDSLLFEIKSLPLLDIYPECQSIVFGSKNDNYPDQININGKIISVSSTLSPCGVICNSGTIAVRLNKNICSYPNNTVYVMILCFYVKEEDYLNKEVKFTARKLYKTEEDCYVNVFNKIDSKGVPFYYLKSKEEIRLK
jgi:hypothetical protein